MDAKNNQNNNDNSKGRVAPFSLVLFKHMGKKKHLEYFVTYLCSMFTTITIVVFFLNCSCFLPGCKKPPCLKIIWCVPNLPCYLSPQGTDFQLGVLPPRKHLALSGDIQIFVIVCERNASGIQEVETRDLLNISHCTGQFLQQRIVQSKMSILLRLRKLEIEKESTVKLSRSFPEYLALIRFNFFIGVGLPRQLVQLLHGVLTCLQMGLNDVLCNSIYEKNINSRVCE